MSKQSFYITTAISYVNGVPHLGHAYESILTDVVARFKRLDGYDVMFLTGTDEHGEKVAKTAEDNDVTPKEFADQNAAAFNDMTQLLNISNDDFIRTTQPRHYTASQALWQRLKENGDIYLGKYEGWYSMREEAYFAEDELHDQNGERLSPNGTPVKWVEEPSYFFRLSNYTDKLLEYFKKHPEFIQPDTRRNEIISFVKGGLKDLSISRHKSRLSWGIPVPDDDDHVMYVWLDALTNYLTALGYPDENKDTYTQFWPAQFHVIGKDIIRFHTVYWPAFLMSANIPLPQTVFAHGFINVGGAKMSKSVGNVLSPTGLVDTYGLDQIRYFLMREIPHGQDGNFSHEQAVLRMNADLANAYGNLVQRTLSMIYKNCDEKIPLADTYTPDDEALLQNAREHTLIRIRERFQDIQIHRALEDIWRLISDANGYIDAQEPWKLKKDDPVRMQTVLYVLADVIRCIATLTAPVMPQSSDKILNQLNIAQSDRDFESLKTPIQSGTQIQKPEGVFPRIVEEEEAA